MYAIVDIAGQQLKVEKDQKVFVNRLEGEEGSAVDFDQVLLIDNDGKIQVGTPVVENTVVNATIVSHLRDETVLVFKKKRRKGYQKLNGHRQYLTEIVITGIGEGKAKARVKVAKVEQPATEESVISEKAEPKAKAAPKAKKAEASKPAAKAAPKKKAEKKSKE
jgi:large subunit ribosomal protein L21